MPEPLHTFRLGEATVQLYAGYTVTRFADGTLVTGRHDDMQQVGQREWAFELGYPDEQAMNREHDLLHNVWPLWLGLTQSPTFAALAHGRAWRQHHVEETFVAAIQRLMRVLNLDAVTLAQRWSEESQHG